MTTVSGAEGFSMIQHAALLRNVGAIVEHTVQTCLKAIRFNQIV